jgi:methylase of polypeptide subunit release factors
MKKLFWHTTGKSQFAVEYTYEMDGGGMSIGTEYIDVIKERYPKKVFKNAYEWCSGPAFIGFNLLDHKICESLICNDIYYPAIECIRHTANANKILNVQALLMEDLSLMPDNYKFDLVVGNPPHFNTSIHEESHRNRIILDTDWSIHQNFFKNIGPHLTDDAVILLQENFSGSRVETFIDMIENAGLKLNDWFVSKDFFNSPRSMFIYYIEITKK